MHFSRIASLPITSVLLLQTFALGQDAGTQDKTTTSSSALTITTTDPMVARGVQAMFGSADAATPKIAEGAALVLSLDDGGKISSRDGAAAGWLTIDARPAQLMRIFKQKVTQGRMMAGMMGGMALGQMGVDAGEVDDVVDAVFEFPNQIDSLHVSMPKKPEKGKAIDIDLDFGPKADTWFGALVAALHQHPQGLRRVPASGAMLTFDADVDMQSVLPIVKPMLDKVMTMMVPDEDLKKQAGEIYARIYKGMAGPVSMSMDTKTGMRMIAELSDAKSMAEVVQDPSYVKITQAASEASGNAKVTIDVKAFEHRGVSLSRSTVEFDESMPANPFAKDGKSVNLGGVVGTTMIGVGMNAGDSDAKMLIDSILDDKLKRAPLANGSLMTLGIDILKFSDLVAEAMGGGAPDGDIPSRADVNMQKTDKGLHIEVRIK